MHQSQTPERIAEQALYRPTRKDEGDGDPVQPDLSHLTPEERRIIEDVINRQRQEELINRLVLIILPSFLLSP